MPRPVPAYHRSPFALEMKADVVDAGTGPSGAWVVTADTIIYPGGGGQPADEGTLRSGDVLFVDRGPAAFSESQQSLLLQRQQYEAQVRRDRAEARNRLFSTALGITSAVISVVTIIILSNQGN